MKSSVAAGAGVGRGIHRWSTEDSQGSEMVLDDTVMVDT